MTTQLKERPIILTAQEVNAVLAGDKTQHRDMVKLPYGYPEFRGCCDSNQGDASLWGWDGFEDGDVRILSEIKCPFGKVGDRLWVRETHHVPDFLYDYEQKELSEGLVTRDSLGMSYKADAPHMTPADGGWCSPVGMPRWASRLILEITDIRIERVQNTSHADAVAEGVHHFDIEACLRDQPLSVAQIVFSRYWDTRHQDGFENWESNPWVWVIEFKKVDC